MKAKYISYQDTHAFSKLVLDYVNDEACIKPFYGFRPDLEGLQKAIQNRNFKGNRKTLVDVLQAQYASIQTHQAVAKNISLLAHDHTYTVTTGHQLNLFTGPLYFIYKIVSTINLAIALKIEFPDKNFVPVYWMATEDHDFNEINHVHVDDKQINWVEQTNGATGRINTENVIAAVNAYKGYLGISKNGKHLAKIISDAYLKHSNLADATRYLVNQLFQKYGLVVINADNALLKKEFSDIIKRDIIDQNSDRLINQTSVALQKNGYNTQVNGRPINFFYLKDELRERIIKSGNGYTINHTSIHFSEQELMEEIENYPDRFSPNVVMRPLYQEIILPNIAYIGGGAEVAYWMQLKENFDYYQVDFPVLLLRNSALVIDKRSANNLINLGFSLEDVFASELDLKNRWVQNSNHSLSLSAEKKALNETFNQIKSLTSKIDKTLIATTESAQVKSNKLLDTLEKKLFKAEKRKHTYVLNQIENVKKRLFPNGTLQERIVNLAPMYVNYGEDFISSLIENFDPLGGDFTLLLPNE